MARLTSRWRWVVILAGVALLLALPAVVRAWPVDAADVPADQLAQRVLASADQPYQGYAETRGGLALPDFGSLSDQAELLGGSSRLRVWYAGPTAWRVDLLGPTGERDVYGDPEGTWEWSSNLQMAERLEVDTQLRLTKPADLLPPELGRRLIGGATPAELTAIDPVRVAGRSVPGLRITPASPLSTVGRVDIWVEPESGLALRVEVTAKGATTPSLESGFLDLSLSQPAAGLLSFEPPAGARVTRSAGDLVQRAETTIPILLPDTLAGLARSTERPSAVATYGEGFDAVAVLAVPSRFVDRLIRDVVPVTVRPWGGTAGLIETPLVNALLFSVDGQAYAVAGAVTVGELDRIGAEVAAGRTTS